MDPGNWPGIRYGPPGEGWQSTTHLLVSLQPGYPGLADQTLAAC
jgi:hypothetical protein